MAVVALTLGYTPSAGTNYTHTVDNSGDYPSVANSTYFYNKADKTVYFKDAVGTIREDFAPPSIEAYITDSTTITNLQNTSNWTGATYTGTAISGTFAGQKHFDASYLFEAVADNLWVRWGRLGITTNLGTGDQTLTGARVVTMGANNLTFSGSSNFKIQSSLGTSDSSNPILTLIDSNNKPFNISAGNQAGYMGHTTGVYSFRTLTGNIATITTEAIGSSKIELGEGIGSRLAYGTTRFVAANNTLHFEITGVEAARINSTRNFGIGETNPTARLHVKGSGTTSGTTALLVQNSGGTGLLSIKDDGTFSATSNVFGTAFNFSSVGWGVNVTIGNGLDVIRPIASGNLPITISNGANIFALTVDSSSSMQFTGIGLIKRISTSQTIGANLGTTGLNGSGTNKTEWLNGTPPTGSSVDCFAMYSADQVAGNAVPHFRTESGNIIKLFRTTNAAILNTPNTGDTATNTLIALMRDILVATGLAGDIGGS